MDKTSRAKLDNINPNEFPIVGNGYDYITMVNYKIPKDFKNYIN